MCTIAHDSYSTGSDHLYSKMITFIYEKNYLLFRKKKIKKNKKGVEKKMIESNFTKKLKEKAELNFENIKESIKGLYEVMGLAIPQDEDSIYYDIASENLSALYKNLLELLMNDYGARDFVKRLKNKQVNIEIPLVDFFDEEEEPEEENYSVN